MRQCGILAAAGIVALEQMVDRLADDHANARRLAEGIAGIPGVDIDPESVQTDIVIFQVTSDRLSAAQLVQALLGRGVQMSAIGPAQIRAVTHYGIEAADIETTLAAMADILE
jgi:threonine aldolase